MKRRDETAAGQSHFETAVDDVLGVDFKIGRTLRDSVLRPGRVADAALANDESRYTRPLKVYLALFAIMTLLFGWSDLGELNTLTRILGDSPEALAYAETRLAAAGSSVAAADTHARDWFGWINWPYTALSSLVFVLAIWAMRPRLKLFKSFQLYLVASNATSVIAVPLVVAGIFLGQDMLIAASFAVMLMFFVYGGLVLHRRAADTAWGLCWRVAGLVFAMAPAIAGLLVVSYATLEIAFESETGLSRAELIAEARSAAAQAAPP